MKAVHARAPVRVDLAGGTLDIWPLYLVLGAPAVTVNVALDLPVEARIRPLPGSRIRLRSDDQGCEAEYADLAALQRARQAAACPLPLLSEAVLAVRPQGGFVLETRAAPPTGSGLGTSSALLCAVLGALLDSSDRGLEARELHPLVQDVETRLLGHPTGHQDYFPPLLGGCLAIHAGVGGLRVERLGVDLRALERRLRLVYTGEPHESGLTNWAVLRAYLDGEAATRRALEGLARASASVASALAGGDLDVAFEALLEDGSRRRAMAPGVSTPRIERLDAAARAAGALGTKICGAGGGGCVLIALPAEGAAKAVDALLAAGPWRPLPLRLQDQGLHVRSLTP